MILDKAINSSYNNPISFNLTGCERLFLTETKNVRGYGFQGRQISSFNMQGTFSVLENLNGISYSVKTEQSKNGTVYVVEVTFSLAGIKADANYMLESLINTCAAVIVEDSNGRYFLNGFQQGLISEYESKTEDGGYTVKMTTRQLAKPEEVKPSLMSTLSYSNFDDQTTPSPTVVLPPDTGNPSGGTTSNTNVNVKIVTTNNYFITATDDFLILPTANSVFLPVSAPTGKRYIIKCDYDASSLSSFVKVTSGDIDNSSQFELNTERPSVTVIYDGAGSWHTVAFSF